MNRSLSIIKQTLNSNPVSIRLMYVTLVVLAAVSVIFGIANAESQTELLHIGDSLALEKTVLNFQVNPNNNLPWGYVQGKVANHASWIKCILRKWYISSKQRFHAWTDYTYERKYRWQDQKDCADFRSSHRLIVLPLWLRLLNIHL